MASYVIGGVVLGALCLAIYKIVKDRKNGKSSCGCGCSTCSCSETETCNSQNNSFKH